MPSGDDPVGRPRTNGFCGVGANDFIRPGFVSRASVKFTGRRTDDVVRDILRGDCLVVPNDEPPSTLLGPFHAI